MGRHSGSNKSGTAKSIWIGILFLLVAGSTYVAANKFFAQQNKPQTIEQSSQTEASTQPETETSAEISTATTNSVSRTSSSTQSKTKPQLDPAELLANAEQVYYGVYYFKNNQELSSNNSAPTVSASVIKVFIMEYAFTKADPAEVVQGRTINDWVVPMIQQSDNRATNVLIDYFGMDTLNQFFQAQGYQDTRLERKMLDTAARSQGKENYTSLNDCMAFLKKLYQQQGAYPQSTMLEIMKGQTVRTKIPSKLTGEITVANKTGELDNAENDIALVLTEDNPFALVVLTKNMTNVAGIRNAIGDFSLAATQIK
ncbi:serine hydrolase [Enterococcus xiangfangensis]|uniref:Class A beta-lactamase-related serine hydrolase n=1 Tax=Enterococcus xiangfangensis TaxID=1296537 RepID=A0ABU3F996_9ENTE|nr:serine hydrolase [Enterococcus xiangfangensis]MDT2758617.1 class A beta-lactamase-related serine hydrolase [Enterococcus xiangfangensis]